MSLSQVFHGGFTWLLTLVTAHSRSSVPGAPQIPLVPSWTRLFTAAGLVGSHTYAVMVAVVPPPVNSETTRMSPTT